MSITLPHDLYDMVKSLVANGGYASDSEVVKEGLRVLKAREGALERWLRDEVIPSYQALKSDPSSGMSVTQVRNALEIQRKSQA